MQHGRRLIVARAVIAARAARSLLSGARTRRSPTLGPVGALRAEANLARSRASPLFSSRKHLLGVAEAVGPLAELTNVDALAAWEAARRPSDIPSLTRDPQFGPGVRRGLLSARVGDR